MRIIGHGIDIVAVERVKEMHAEHGQRFLDRCFTKAEQDYCRSHSKRMYEHMAGRFAAKEAVLKALGTGWRGGIGWTDIEIRAEVSGQPAVFLTGEAAKIATGLGISQWFISISHIEATATSSVIASGL